MKRLLFTLMISLLFCSCGAQRDAELLLEEKREEISRAGYISFEVDTAVELSQSVFECRLKVVKNEDGLSMEVLEPELIAGIKASIGEDGGQIEYEQLVLSVGDAYYGQLSPISVMPLVLEAFSDAFVNSVWREQQGEVPLIAAQSYVSENEYMKIWFAEENMLPLYAELVSDGRIVVKCRIEEFSTIPEM